MKLSWFEKMSVHTNFLGGDFDFSEVCQTDVHIQTYINSILIILYDYLSQKHILSLGIMSLSQSDFLPQQAQASSPRGTARFVSTYHIL